MIHMTVAPPPIYDEETLICFLRLVPRPRLDVYDKEGSASLCELPIWL
jgi:hypothetical protein